MCSNCTQYISNIKLAVKNRLINNNNNKKKTCSTALSSPGV